VIAAVVAVVALALVLVVVLLTQYRERQGWAAERRALVDRAIARHVGEVAVLDRTNGRTKPQREPEPPKLIEGLT
jgi:predicted signal transduction protein with EAL and GGDEF domain